MPRSTFENLDNFAMEQVYLQFTAALLLTTYEWIKDEFI